MTEADRTDLYMIWQQLAQRNDWRLVEDEAAFLDQALAEAHTLVGDTPPNDGTLRVAIRRTYSLRLFRGLQTRNERAAQELWIAAFRLSRRAGWTETEAEDLAQETLVRVIEKLPALRSPQSLLDWLIMLLRTVQRDYRRKQRNEESWRDDDGEQHESADPLDLEAQVEAYVVSELIEEGLDAAESNIRDQIVLRRTVLYGDKPAAIALELGMPVQHVRLAKSRALKRLRASPTFQILLSQLRDSAAIETAETGVDTHDT